MKSSGDSTHPQHPTSPEGFRAKATGIGQSQAMSQATGAARAARVAPTIKCPGCVPEVEGYPAVGREAKSSY